MSSLKKKITYRDVKSGDIIYYDFLDDHKMLIEIIEPVNSKDLQKGFYCNILFPINSIERWQSNGEPKLWYLDGEELYLVERKEQ